MGAVYLAHRADGEFEQKVAVKLIGGPLAIEAFRERFRRERQILAGLNHPNITRLLDGGTTPEGAPYLAMEYVEGRPIDQDCDARRLPVNARVRLFLEVCEAVDYAHRNLVVHCDLKPSNIMVTREGAPKLLDFGTARLQQSGEMAGATIPLMTPRYASPEQIRSGPAHVSTDVYSLGIVLYELLTGAWPFGDPSGEGVLTRLTREVTPGDPAEAVTAAAAELRSASQAALRRQLAGDLASILTMALEHDPARRYGSVRAFAEDLRKYLAGEPVLARRLTFLYRAEKFVRRNVWYVTAGVLAVAAMLSATGVSIGYGRKAVREADRARKISHFNTQTLLAAVPSRFSPMSGHPGAITLENLLDNAAGRAGRDLGSDPAAEAEIHSTLGTVWMHLGNNDKAVIELNLALEKWNLVKDQPIDNQRATLLVVFCNVESSRGNYQKAQSYCREASAVLSHAAEPEPDLAVGVPHDLAYMSAKVDAPLEEVESGYRTSANAAQRYYSTTDIRWYNAMTRIATCRYDAGDLRKAEGILEPIVVRLRAEPGPPVDLFPPLRALGQVRRTQGRPREAQALFQEALDLAHNRPTSYFSTDAIEIELLLTRALQREAAQVAPRSRQLLRSLTASSSAGHLDRARPEYLAGRILALAGFYTEADPLLRDAARIYATWLPHWPGLRAEVLAALAQSLAAQRAGSANQGEAGAVRREAIDLFQKAYGAFAAGHPAVTELRELNVVKSVGRNREVFETSR